MNRQEYIRSLKCESNELASEIRLLKRFSDFIEEQLQIYDEEISRKDDRIQQINTELDDLESNIWPSTEESLKSYMNDVLD